MTPPTAAASGAGPLPRVRRKFHVVLHLLAAGLLAGAAVAVSALPEIATHWWRLQTPLLAAAGVLALMAAVPPQSRPARFSRRVCVLASAAILGLATSEAFFRVVRFDFRRQAAALERTPPFYRKPALPCGTVFFRRQGPLEWTGQPIRDVLRTLHLEAGAYADEPPVRVHYDAFGFRNHPRPEVWEIAVAGDSFTELGHLPDEDLFTTRLAARLGCRVLNLGASNTGPLTHLTYLAEFGRSPATREAVIVFYEGNDWADLAYESAAEQRFRATGRRPTREIRPQTSFLRALGEWVRTGPRPAPPVPLPVDAWLLVRTGRVAVTLGPPPPTWEDLPPTTRAACEDFLSRFADWARARAVRPWLAFMPVKQRVWHGLLEFSPAATPEMQRWQPTDAPTVLAAACARHHIRFVDLTPALQADTRTHGEPGFNLLYDTHLNARGARVVAEALARALGEPASGSAAAR
jgi:lysophospholipase L1-like esterase